MFTKICGLTTVGDALAATAAGVDAIGLNFVPTSKRWIDQTTATEIVSAVRAATDGDLLVVGVFSDQPVGDVAQIAVDLGLDAVQLHGAESPADVSTVAALLPDETRVIKVFAPPRFATIDCYDCDIVMLDAPHGGGGEPFDWSLAAEIATPKPVLLAGGLTPANVARAIAAVQPWGVDVATGVESTPGRTDPTLVAEFIAATKT